jgi:hypothetical protein
MTVPIYGSPEYQALPEGHPDRQASMEHAAECWRLEGTEEAIAARLRDEIEFNNWYTAYRLRELSKDLSEGLRGE